MTVQLAEVHTIYKTNAASIPAMLRQAADNIETEDANEHPLTRAMVAIQLTEDGGIEVYGWGDVVDSVYAIGILQKGILKIAGALE